MFMPMSIQILAFLSHQSQANTKKAKLIGQHTHSMLFNYTFDIIYKIASFLILWDTHLKQHNDSS